MERDRAASAYHSKAANVASAFKDGAEVRASNGSMPAARRGKWAVMSEEGMAVALMMGGYQAQAEFE